MSRMPSHKRRWIPDIGIIYFWVSLSMQDGWREGPPEGLYLAAVESTYA